jgi:hypothetical protein
VVVSGRVESLFAAGVCTAAAVLLGVFAHAIGLSPRVWLPIQFPVFLAGTLLSPAYAALVGIMAPALCMGFSGLPTADQAMRMIPELAVYGAATALLLRRFPRLMRLGEKAGRLAALITAMLSAMLLGRLAYVLAAVLFSGAEGASHYVRVLITPALPGIAVQFVLIPLLAYRFQPRSPESRGR